MSRYRRGDMEELFQIVRLLVEAKRQGTWKFTHAALVISMIAMLGGMVAFICNLILRTEHAMYFIGVALLGIVSTIIFSTVVRIQQRHSQPRPRSAEEAGKAGEQHTLHQLKYLGPRYKVWSNIRLRLGQEQQEIDLLVVGPSGVFHIENKAYSGHLVFTPTGLTRDGRGVEDPTGQVYRHQYMLESILNNGTIACDITGVICFSDSSSTLTGVSPAFLTCKVDRLLHEIKSFPNQHTLDEAAIEEVAAIVRKHAVRRETSSS